ncbi:DUF1987 domain-containing protein [Flammeovirga sp. EKP202]|uniref:DUF1987 domain-containing protein n=1 Tax=Flammeovirga sp. EKP202 TaxID=2770592 RepID=UPI00165F85E5|nr:DUF1987 domain-containing protein [Flammeovirga sp. EKP202]MBD0402118.1 DUF1987 domain-containing protein [Flammeovirga sp. EKP202]
MKDFLKKDTPKTPLIQMEYESGYFLISGRSIPENSIEFYRPLFEWLDEYNTKPQTKTQFDVRLEYFNTSSSKCLVEVFRKLEFLKASGHEVEVNWYYEEDDEDMQESGEDFKEVIKLPIHMHILEE